ncbi:cysteinyl leukotriene receptor 1-like [Stegostoma tigrinum]|uniref:cysteinyl leukotriene receptor 1-like n=1 Tax=Stegostoma tigrinum TaxID=3053191 RepID=UPI00202B2CFE|nr:cysteinyl leukotriene receptor 1-like [Stegostoma tigrinum]XP_048398224.1 cysteinyl leukotriene receptor 1-like [Stegostoma tigrinum]
MMTNALLRENVTIANTSSNRTVCPENHEYKYMVYSTVYSVVFVVGLLSNLSALFVFYRIAKSKNSSTVYLMNLAVADLLFVLSLPLRIVYYLRKGDWPFRDFLCRVSTYTFYVSMYCSIFFLTCLSISRFLATVHHIRHQRMFTFRRCIIACIIIWLFVGVATAPFLLSESQPYHGKIKCFEPVFVVSWTRIAKMNYFALTVGFLIPFVIILICYCLMIKYLMGVSWQSRRIKRDIAMIVLVLAVFLICFLPYHVQRTVHLHYLVHHHNDCELENILRKSVVATLCLAVANSCFDPLLYIFVGQGFRTFVRAWLKRKESNVSYSSSSSKLFVSAAFIQQGRMLESFTEPIKPSQTLLHEQKELLSGKSQGDDTVSSKTETVDHVLQNSPQ